MLAHNHKDTNSKSCFLMHSPMRHAPETNLTKLPKAEVLHAACTHKIDHGARPTVACNTCQIRIHMAHMAFPSNPAVPCTVDVSLGNKSALQTPSSTNESRSGATRVFKPNCGGTKNSADSAQLVGVAIVANTTVRQCVALVSFVKTIAQAPTTNGGGGTLTKFAPARVAMWVSRRTACSSSSSPKWHPDAYRVHIKIIR